MRRSFVLLALAALACSDVSGPTLALPSGSLHVWYDVPADGGERSLSATGELSLVEGRLEATGFAAAGQSAKVPEKLTVVGFTPLAENGTRTGRVFAVTLPIGSGGRTVPILENCFDATCAATLFFNGVDADDPHREVNPSVDRACALTAGSVVITEQSAARVKGTFSGTGYCVYDNRTDPFLPFAVDSAAFDVPIDLRYRPRIDLY